MDAFAIPLPLPLPLPLHHARSVATIEQTSSPSSRTSRGFLLLQRVDSSRQSRVRRLNGSASSSFENSSQEDGADEPPITKKDVQGDLQNGGTERIVNGEKKKSAKDELPTTPAVRPINEDLHPLRRDAQLKSIIEELKYNRSMKSPQQQPCADLEVHKREVRVPSWAVTALSMAVAFSAGVALAQFRGGLFSKNKSDLHFVSDTRIVDSRVAPSGIAAVSYPEQLLGHFRAEVAPESDIKSVLADGSVGLRTAAAEAFLRMQDAARSEDIWLSPLSGFRSVRTQEETFFDIMAERRQSVTDRARVSAPSGYSEHHTGYAIDIGDADDPKTNFEEEFEEGAAFRWLQQNAARYHFELSFPRGNSQGIMYEPWHWRFVGDSHSLQTFHARAKQT